MLPSEQKALAILEKIQVGAARAAIIQSYMSAYRWMDRERERERERARVSE